MTQPVRIPKDLGSDPEKIITTRQLAALTGWEIWRARRWVKKNGVGFREPGERPYGVRIGTVLERFPRIARKIEQLSNEHAAHVKMEARLDSAEARIRALEKRVSGLLERAESTRRRLATLDGRRSRLSLDERKRQDAEAAEE